MKNKITSLSSAIIALAVVLSSCSSKKSMFTSRKYTKGIYFASKGKAGKVEKINKINAEIAKAELQDVEIVKANSCIKIEKNETIAPLQTLALSNSKPAKNVVTVDKKVTASTHNSFVGFLQKADIKSLNNQTVFAKKQYKDLNEKAQSFNKKPSKGALIVLAIFIPLLAVYLKDGVGKSFWINLVLCLLFYLPGIIHALVVVTRK